MELKIINKRRMCGATISEYLPILGLIATILVGGVAQYGNEARKQSSRMSIELAGVDAPFVASNSASTPGYTGGSNNSGSGQTDNTSQNHQNGTGSGSTGGSQVVAPADGTGQQINPVTGQPIDGSVVSGGSGDGAGTANTGAGQNDAGVLEQVVRFIEGAANGMKTQITGIIQMVLNPIETANALKELAVALVTEPEETLKVLAEVFKEDLEKLASGDPYLIGEVIGENVSPATLVAIVSKLRKIDKIANSTRRQDTAKDVDTACSSFLAGTAVWTENGMVPIETLAVGDPVHSRHDETFADKPQRITHLFHRDVTHYYEVDTGYEVIRTTEEHPFWLQGKGWTPASQLKVGDVLARAEGDIQIHKVRRIQGPASVYNFTVEKTHNYFVGPNKLWVHNANVVCDLAHTRYLAIRARIPAHLRNDFDKDFADPRLKEALLNKPNLADGWVAIHGKGNLRVDLDVLNKATDILNSPKLKAAGLDRDALQRIVAAQEAAKAAAPDFKELLDNILAAEKYADSPGFDKVLSSLQNPALNGAPQIGANYTLKYLKENGHDIKGIVFEEKVLGGDRIVDMKGFKNDTEIFYEFKSVKDIPPGRFGEQFTKDLINAGGLDNIKWVFDEKKIPDNVLKAHKDELLKNLKESLDKLDDVEKDRLLVKYGGENKLKDVPELIEVISKNFDKLFEVY